MAMTSKQEVLPALFALLVFISVSDGQNVAISEGLKKIFLTKHFNSTETEWILKSARDSYLRLKSVEKQFDVNEQLNFANNYANFLLKLFKELQAEDVDIYQIFSKENSFLKDYSPNQPSGGLNVTGLIYAMEDVQFEAERHLINYYNSSQESYDALKVLDLNETSFQVFLKEKMRTDYSEIGYFFLEVFATLVGLSWGIISTVLHIARPMNDYWYGACVFLTFSTIGKALRGWITLEWTTSGAGQLNPINGGGVSQDGRKLLINHKNIADFKLIQVILWL